MALSTLDDLFFKSYEPKIFSFIWDAKPDKIQCAYLYLYICIFVFKLVSCLETHTHLQQQPGE
jgi:hypothetical protein